VVEELAQRLGIAFETRAVKETEMRSADEVWIASATRNVSAVTRIDGQPIGSGKPGPVWTRMWEGFSTLQHELAGQPW
jgi:D-alanine transaminase